MRIVGSGLIIAAYFITLHLDVVTGVAVHLTAMSIPVPYFIKSKAWDVVIMMTFLMSIGAGRLVTAADMSNLYLLMRDWSPVPSAKGLQGFRTP